MEMEYQDPGRRSRFVVVVGLILAIVAGGAAFFLISQAQQQAGQASVQKVSIVVARQQIPARKAIESADVELRDVPVDGTNAQGVFSDPNKVIGLIPGVTILAGQPIYANFLASTSQGSQFTILDPGETVGPDSVAWRAVSMTVPDDRAVGGLVRPGDTVDVFATLAISLPQSIVDQGKYYADKSTKITYQDLVVLAKTNTFYVLKVPLNVAEEIDHLQASGAAAFSFALRPAEDARTVDASALGETTNLIIQRYGLPIPQVFPTGSGGLPAPALSASPNPSPSPSSGGAGGG